MSGNPNRFIHFWQEVKRRNVHRSLAIYAGTAFIILEAATIVFPRWGFPDWSIDLVLYLLIIGAIINIIVAWIFDITPQGIKKTKSMEEVSDAEQKPDSRRWKAATYISLVVIIALVVFNVFTSTKTLRAGDIQSLLVLPFDNFTGDDQLDYVAAGMHSSLIGDMGQISGLRIISKTTANIYKNMELSLPEMATELNADAVVEPTVMCYGDSVCIQIRVITPFPEEKQLWIGEYKEEKSQIFNLYSRVTKQIADEIKVSLTPFEEEVLTQTRIVNIEAYDLYMRGQYYWAQLTPEALQIALEYFNKAILVDPDWAPPYAGIAAFWIGVRQMGLAPSSITVPNIYKYLNKTIELDPLNPLIQGLVAVVYGHIGNIEQTIELDKQIIQVVPNHPLALGALWEANYWLGNYEESFRYCGKLFNLGEENSELILGIYKQQGNISAVEKVISIIEAIPDEQIPVSASIRIATMYLMVDKIDEPRFLPILEKMGLSPPLPS